MNVRIQPISEISTRARNLLIQELGIVDSMRFLNQYRVGHGDYTADRTELLKDDSVKSLIAAIKAHRNLPEIQETF